MQDARDGDENGDARDEGPVEVRCPECDARVRVPRAVAERDMQARCPQGHAIVLFRAI